MSISPDVVRSWIHQAQTWIDLGKLNEAHDLLKHTEDVVLHSLENSQESERQVLLAETYNNQACYYNKCNKPKLAASLLTQAIQLQIKANANSVTLAKTNLNLAAALSLLGRHEDSLNHAMQALNLLTRGEENDEAIETIAIAHHSFATQNEHLGRLGDAVLHYRLALDQLKRLSWLHPLMSYLEEALQDAENRNTSIAMFVSERQSLRERARVGHRIRPTPLPSWVPSSTKQILPSKVPVPYKAPFSARRSVSPRRKKNRLAKLKPQNLTLDYESIGLPDISKGTNKINRTNMYNIN